MAPILHSFLVKQVLDVPKVEPLPFRLLTWQERSPGVIFTRISVNNDVRYLLLKPDLRTKFDLVNDAKIIAFCKRLPIWDLSWTLGWVRLNPNRADEPDETLQLFDIDQHYLYPAGSFSADSPQPCSPQQDSPLQGASQPAHPHQDAPQDDAPQADAPQEDASQQDAPQQDAAQQDSLQPGSSDVSLPEPQMVDVVSCLSKALILVAS